MAKKRGRCPDCGAVLRRLYYQTGAGRRRFVGCGWGCFECPGDAIAPSRDAIARRRETVPEPDENFDRTIPPEPEPEPEPEPDEPGFLQSLARGIVRAADRSADRTAEKVEQSDRHDRATAAGVPPDLLASIDHVAGELVSEQRGKRKR